MEFKEVYTTLDVYSAWKSIKIIQENNEKAKQKQKR